MLEHFLARKVQASVGIANKFRRACPVLALQAAAAERALVMGQVSPEQQTKITVL